MLDFIDFKGKDHSYFSKQNRMSPDGKQVSGTFIINQTEKNIYKRFRSQFGGKLKSFICTPNDIVVLNKIKVHGTEQIKYSIPISFNRK